MMKTEFAKPITVEEIIFLHEKYGMTVEINDGEVSNVSFTERG